MGLRLKKLPWPGPYSFKFYTSFQTDYYINIYSLIAKILQGRLKIWTEHSTLILLNLKPFANRLQKFQHIYNSERNEFSPNLEGVTNKLDLPCPFDVLDTFGGKSKSKAPRALKFGTKRVPIEVNNWWKFGADISKHFWDIQNQRFFFLPSVPHLEKK